MKKKTSYIEGYKPGKNPLKQDLKTGSRPNL